MRKSDKKIDDEICNTLTQLCENELKKINGFEWLTHQVNYKRFPNSLKIICVFDNVESLGTVEIPDFCEAIQQRLTQIGIRITAQQISFDTEEQCQQRHDGNWKKRLNDQ